MEFTCFGECAGCDGFYAADGEEGEECGGGDDDEFDGLRSVHDAL